MTEIETRIQQTEAAIKVTEIAILKAKTYARRIYEEKIKRDLEQQLAELKNENNEPQPGTVEAVAGDESEASDKTKQNE